MPTCRGFLTLSALSPAAIFSGGRALARPAALQADLERYHGFGDKGSGGPGDEACSAWLEGELKAVGFTTRVQTFLAPMFSVRNASLSAGGRTALLIPQAIPMPTGPDGVSGPLAVRHAGGRRRRIDGAVALVVLPHGRWSSAVAPAVSRPVREAIEDGAAGVVVVTTGPTGEALALNGPADAPLFAKPTAVIAPVDAEAFMALDGEPARLVIDGQVGRRRAGNLVGELNRGAGRRLVVSTPRSGWFGCAGERGPGIAVWLALARRCARAELPVDLTFLATSGHEYENLGGAAFLERDAPPPAEVALWFHLGANLAARDWHEAGRRLLPLPGADPNRFLIATPDLIDLARRVFQGQPGLEAPYPAGAGAEGELKHILAAGYRSVVGVFGGHRFHHARGDDMRCVSGDLVTPTARSFEALVDAFLTPDADPGDASGRRS